LPAEFRELVDLIVTYAKQQTIDPLKQLGRWVAFGLAGAVLVGLGFLLVGVGLLRAVQSEAGKHLAGNWSWVPYVIVVVFLGAVIGLMVRRMSQRPGSEER
jgi:multisubunit Na+/H+ antiporter MnhB subunit